VFIDRGRIVLDCSMEDFEARYLELMVGPEHLAAARALGPIRLHGKKSAVELVALQAASGR